MLSSLLLLLSAAACWSGSSASGEGGCREKPFFRDAGPLVATEGGKVVGKYVKVFDSDVAAFLGIPFAEPPTRFQKPEKARPWDGLMLAHDKPPPCMQYSAVPHAWLPTTRPSEDCLYLNVWSPARRAQDEAGLMPVLVWIHGGGLNSGSTDMDIYDGSVLAAYGHVLVVSMNYRLGAFGFLSAGTESAPGNVGLHDQLMAIRWVRDNIGQFGGDPDKVTLFGESAGAWSISLHLVSPLSRGLFRRAILQSGSMYHPALADSSAAAGNKLAEFAALAGCHREGDIEGTVDCLKGKDAAELARLENSVTHRSVVLFLPSVGNEFLPRAPVAAYEDGDIQQVDVLLGNVRDEGTLFLPIMAPEVFRFESAPSLSAQQAESAARTLFQTLPKQAVDAVVDYYFNQWNSSGDPRDLSAVVGEAFGDSFFNCPAVFLAEKLEKGRVYWLTHGGGAGGWLGVHHFSDVAYVFGAPILDSANYSPEDGKFSGDLIRIWADFARTGHPLRDGDQRWPPFTRVDPVALELNPRSSTLLPHPRFDACDALWRPLFATPYPPPIITQEDVEVTF